MEQPRDSRTEEGLYKIYVIIFIAKLFFLPSVFLTFSIKTGWIIDTQTIVTLKQQECWHNFISDMIQYIDFLK